jgi:hypothetical protein
MRNLPKPQEQWEQDKKDLLVEKEVLGEEELIH